MLDALVTNLIGSLADVIASTAMTTVDDHQQRRDKLADYEARAHGQAEQLLAGVVAVLQPAVRNRYLDWIAHPRLGHEPPAAELRAAEIGLNEAVLELKANPSLLNRVLAIAASIRLTAITEALGVACIYRDAATRPAPVQPKRAIKPVRADDRRLKRRAPTIDDVPDALRPVVARLDTSHSNRVGAIEELEAQRAGPLDGDGIATRLAALAAHAEYQAFVDTLAAQAAVIDGPAEAAPVAIDMAPSPPSVPTQTLPVADGRVAHSTSTATSVSVTSPRTDEEIEADIAMVTKFVGKHRWALIERGGRYSVKKLDSRVEVNFAFERVADLPAMQDQLGRIHASQRPSAS